MRARGRYLTAGATATAVACGVMLTMPVARAEGVVSACHWIDREYSQTYTCEEPTEALTHLDIVECWKFPAPARTYVRQKTDSGWIRNKAITVKVTGNRGCEDPYAFRTVVRVPAEFLADMTTTRLRLTMPATSGTLSDGTEYSFGKTVVTYGACLMPEDASDWCPER